jgi:UDPglucose--hexose-1-phosphate uridylyltransferase
MRRQIESARRYRESTGECLHCVLLAAERRAGTRIVAENDLVTVVVPHAARWPYEAHVYPRRHVPDLPALTDAERAAVARAYLDLLQRFDRLFPTPTPYIAAWMQAPARDDRELMHLHAEVFSIRRAAGKLKYLAGSESGAEVWINDISPEGAAAALRGETR